MKLLSDTFTAKFLVLAHEALAMQADKELAETVRAVLCLCRKYGVTEETAEKAAA